MTSIGVLGPRSVYNESFGAISRFVRWTAALTVSAGRGQIWAGEGPARRDLIRFFGLQVLHHRHPCQERLGVEGCRVCSRFDDLLLVGDFLLG